MSFRSGSSVTVLGQLFGLLGASFVGGCAYGEVRQVVRAQFASELDCPEVQIKRRDAWYGYDTGNQFKVSGCGVMRTYTCNDPDGRVSYDEPACTWVAGDADAPKMAKPQPDDAAMDEPMPDEPEPDAPADDAPAGGEEPAADPFEESEGASEPEAESEDDAPPPPAKPAVKKGGSKVGKVSR